MARITVHAVHTDGEPRRWTLSERIVAANLDSGHYVAQLIERLSWATADAEALESPGAAPSASASRVPTGTTHDRDPEGLVAASQGNAQSTRDGDLFVG